MADSQVFEGSAPGSHEGMLELRAGRWMMVWFGVRKNSVSCPLT